LLYRATILVSEEIVYTILNTSMKPYIDHWPSFVLICSLSSVTSHSSFSAKFSFSDM